jgi:hypothetical protein
METPRWKRVRGKGGFVTGLILDTGDDKTRTDTDEWHTAYQVRTDAADLADDEAEYRRGLLDYSQDRRMNNHRAPLAATKDACSCSPKAPRKRQPQQAQPVARRDGISSDAARRMGNHRQPLKYHK